MLLVYVFRPPNETEVRWAADEKPNTPEDEPKIHIHGTIIIV